MLDTHTLVKEMQIARERGPEVTYEISHGAAIEKTRRDHGRRPTTRSDFLIFEPSRLDLGKIFHGTSSRSLYPSAKRCTELDPEESSLRYKGPYRRAYRDVEDIRVYHRFDSDPPPGYSRLLD